jgi:hypothetical protein
MLSGLYPLSQGAALLKENLRSIVVFLNYFVKFKKEEEDKIMSERNRTGGRSEPKEEENRIFCSRMPFFVFLHRLLKLNICTYSKLLGISTAS